MEETRAAHAGPRHASHALTLPSHCSWVSHRQKPVECFRGSDRLPATWRGSELEPWRLSWTHITTQVIPANPPSKNGRIPNSLRGSSLPPNQVRLPPNQVQVHLLQWRSPMWKCKKGGHFSCFSFCSLFLFLSFLSSFFLFSVYFGNDLSSYSHKVTWSPGEHDDPTILAVLRARF